MHRRFGLLDFADHPPQIAALMASMVPRGYHRNCTSEAWSRSAAQWAGDRHTVVFEMQASDCLKREYRRHRRLRHGSAAHGSAALKPVLPVTFAALQSIAQGIAARGTDRNDAKPRQPTMALNIDRARSRCCGNGIIMA